MAEKKKGYTLLKILRWVLSIATFSLAVYGLVTGDFEFSHIMIFFLGLTLLILGIEEFLKERKVIGMLLVGVFLFSLFVSINGFFLG